VGTFVAEQVGGGSDGLHARGYIPVAELGTTSMQQAAIAIIFFMTFLAFAVWAVRMYSRWSSKTIGIGKFSTRIPYVVGQLVLVVELWTRHSFADLCAFADDWLTTVAMVSLPLSLLAKPMYLIIFTLDVLCSARSSLLYV
jgi:hypothetical protein